MTHGGIRKGAGRKPKQTSKSIDADQYYSDDAKFALYGPTKKRGTGHGGPRPGCGRKPKEHKRILINFTLAPETVERLRHNVPPYGRSAFVEAAILSQLQAGSRNESA